VYINQNSIIPIYSFKKRGNYPFRHNRLFGLILTTQEVIPHPFQFPYFIHNKYDFTCYIVAERRTRRETDRLCSDNEAGRRNGKAER
jgi:hypothetical protein